METDVPGVRPLPCPKPGSVDRPWGCDAMRRMFWHDGAVLVLGVWLFVSSWVLAPTVVVAVWNAWLFGGLVAFLGVWTLVYPDAATAEGIVGVLGLWLFMSPWSLAYSGVHPEDWNAWMVGVLVVLLPAWKDRAVRQRTRGELGGTILCRAAGRPADSRCDHRMLPLSR